MACIFLLLLFVNMCVCMIRWGGGSAWLALVIVAPDPRVPGAVRPLDRGEEAAHALPRQGRDRHDGEGAQLCVVWCF